MDGEARVAWRPSYATVLFGACILYGVYLHWGFWTVDVQGQHAWRQAATMWNVRNYVRVDANPFHPRAMVFGEDGLPLMQRLEFPVYQYFVSLLYRAFGEHIVLARATSYACTVAGAWALMRTVARLTGSAVGGALAAGFYLTAPLLFLYCICPIPDVLALGASWWYVYGAIHYFAAPPPGRQRKYLAIAGVGLCVATFAKLPFLLVSTVSVYFFVKDLVLRRAPWTRGVANAALQLALVAPALAWYAWVIPTWGDSPTMHPSITAIYDNPEATQWARDHVNQLLPQRLLGGWNVPLALLGLGVMVYRRAAGWWLALFGMTVVYWLLELETINFVHDYYMLPFLVPLFVVVGFGASALQRLGVYVEVGLVVLLLYAGQVVYDKASPMYGYPYTYFDDDVLRYSEELAALAPRDAPVLIMRDVSHAVFGWRVDKQGYVIDGDSLPEPWLDDMVDRLGIRYLYSNQAKVNNDPLLRPHIDTLVGAYGGVHVYRLRPPVAQ